MLSISNGVVSGVLSSSKAGGGSHVNSIVDENVANTNMVKVFEFLCERCTIDLSSGSLRKAVAVVIILNLKCIDHQVIFFYWRDSFRPFRPFYRLGHAGATHFARFYILGHAGATHFARFTY